MHSIGRMRIPLAGLLQNGMAETFEPKETLERLLGQPLDIDGLATLRESLAAAASVLYLADNAGETVLDLLTERESQVNRDTSLGSQPDIQRTRIGPRRPAETRPSGGAGDLADGPGGEVHGNEVEMLGN